MRRAAAGLGHWDIVSVAVANTCGMEGPHKGLRRTLRPATNPPRDRKGPTIQGVAHVCAAEPTASRIPDAGGPLRPLHVYSWLRPGANEASHASSRASMIAATSLQRRQRYQDAGRYLPRSVEHSCEFTRATRLHVKSESRDYLFSCRLSTAMGKRCGPAKHTRQNGLNGGALLV